MKSISRTKIYVFYTALLALPTAVILVAALTDSQQLYDPFYNVFLHVSGDFNAGQNYYYRTVHAAYVGQPSGITGWYRFRAGLEYDTGYVHATIPFRADYTRLNGPNAWNAETQASNYFRTYSVFITR